MCCLGNISMRDYQESVTTRQTDRQADRQTPDKVILMCRYASQAIGVVTIREKHIAIYCDIFSLYCDTCILRYIPFIIFSVKSN